MTLIDTSAWIEYFRRRGEIQVKDRVDSLVTADQAAYTCPIHFELFSGIRPWEMDLAKGVLATCERLLFQPDFWEAAANLDRGLKSQGITMKRGDLFIATAASEYGVPLLCRDRHFDIIRDHGGLNLQLEQMA